MTLQYQNIIYRFSEIDLEPVTTLDEFLASKEITKNPSISMKCKNGHIITMTLPNIGRYVKSANGCRECKKIPNDERAKLACENFNFEFISYNSKTTSVEYKCVCGEISKTNLSNLVNKPNRKSQCAKCKFKNMEIIKEIFEKKGCKLLSTEYSDTFEYICKCGRHQTTNLTKFKAREKPCTMCDIPYTSTVKKIFTDLGCTPLFDDFTAMRQILPYICVCGATKNKNGKQLTTEYYKISAGQLCQWCGDRKRTCTIEDAKKIFTLESCELVSDYYENCFTPLQYYCSCGNKDLVTTTLNRFQNGHRCMKCGNAKITLEKIKELLEEKGCTLVTEYYDTNEKIKFICKCGSSAEVNRDQLTKTDSKWDGCRDCWIKRQRRGYDYVFDSFKERGCLLLTTTYNRRHEQLECICPCGNLTTLSFAELSFGKLCDDCTKNDREVGTVENVKSFVSEPSEKLKNKIQQVLEMRYGIDYCSAHPDIIQKELEKTVIEECKPRKKETYNSFKWKEYTFPSGKIVKIQGYEHFSIDYFLQDDDVTESDIITNSGEMPLIKYSNPVKNGKESRWIPDIWIPSKNLLIEVKSDFTYSLRKQKNKAKCKAGSQQGYNVMLQIWDKNGNLIKEKLYPAKC